MGFSLFFNGATGSMVGGREIRTWQCHGTGADGAGGRSWEVSSPPSSAEVESLSSEIARPCKGAGAGRAVVESASAAARGSLSLGQRTDLFSHIQSNSG